MFYQATFAGRTKRVMKYFQLENVVDTIIFLIGIAYLSIILKKYRYNSFTSNPDKVTEARMYWDEYAHSFVNEGLLLWILVGVMWVKAFN
jgi:hypothetical protein